jgi:adenylate cyclase
LLDIGRIYVEVSIAGEDLVFELTDTPTLSIGRSPQNTVVLDDDTMVSRKHALVQREAGGAYYLSDLGSRNGTTLNGVPVTAPVALADGDTFTAGSHRFTFHDQTQREEKEVVAQDPTDVLVVERMITILVIDLRDYTVLARELGEARISEIMNKLFHESGRMLKRKGSWAQKYIGDAVMAFWVHGEEEGTPRSIVLMLEALVELAVIIDGISTEYAPPRPLAFGAGINSGVAVTGNMGTTGISDHTAMGDAVNKAFRLESTTKEIGRQIVVGHSTFRLMSLPPEIEALFTPHDVKLKGYDALERVYALDLDQLRTVIQALGR